MPMDLVIHILTRILHAAFGTGFICYIFVEVWISFYLIVCIKGIVRIKTSTFPQYMSLVAALLARLWDESNLYIRHVACVGRS